MSRYLLGAAIAAVALAAPTVLMAAPLTYQAAVTANNPYLYYRFNDTGSPAADASGNGRTGTYTGAPTLGVAGTGLLSDNAASFPGTSTTPTVDYIQTSNARTLGSQSGRSSYEMIFKTNVVGLTGYQSLFGVFNAPDATTTPARTNTGAVAIELNSNATGNLSATTSRFYIRDETNRVQSATIANSLAGVYNLLDGNYHHLVFTFDVNETTSPQIRAYVDGLNVAATLVAQGLGAPTAATASYLDFTVDPTFGARNLRGPVGNESNVTIDEGVLYGNTVLDAATVAAHAAAAGFLVPEPTSLAALGMGAFALVRRRKA